MREKIEFTYSGFDCVAIMQDKGFWCGYVGVPSDHPWHGRDYDDIDAEVHGGLTYAEDKLPDNTRPDKRWIGFDCAHVGDAWPGCGFSGVYRDLDYVKSECESLARQAAVAY